MTRRTLLVHGAAAAMLAGVLTAVPVSASAGSGSSAAPDGAAAEGAASEGAARTAAAAGLKWKDCGTESAPRLQCSTLRVPLDHSRPGGKKISLALSRIPHTAKKSSGPLLVNPGGPGGSGLTLAGFVAGSLPAKVAARYDVIGFDPRGVGKSQPALDCKPGHFDAVRPDSVPDSPKVERANLARAKGFAEACSEKYGDVLPFVNTVSAVKDMDRIRAALGSKKISYFGYSYGTYLGAVYAKRFPDRVKRVVLDSIVDPTGVWYEDNIAQDYAFDARHKAFAAWVADHDGTYRLGTDPAAVEKQWYEMRAAVAKNPAGGKVGAAELEDTFLPGGYYNGYWPVLADAFAGYVNDGDKATLVETYESFAAIDAAGDNGYSVYASVQCRDASWPRDWRTWRRDMWNVHRDVPFMTWNNAWYNAPCAFWPTNSKTPVDVANKKLPPVLLFQATDDAATPYRGGVTMHRKLRGSSLVVEDGGGNHGITLGGNACLDAHLADYLATGKVPRGGEDRADPDAVCKALPDPEPAAAANSRSAAPGSGGSADDGSAERAAELHELIGTSR